MDDPEAVDISTFPELKRLAEEVQRSRKPRILRVGEEDVAILRPIAQRRGRGKTPSKEDLEAFRSSAGAWEGIVDCEQLIADIYESRERSIRPRVDP